MNDTTINYEEHNKAESTGVFQYDYLQGEALIECYREGEYDVWYKEGNFCYSHLAPELEELYEGYEG